MQVYHPMLPVYAGSGWATEMGKCRGAAMGQSELDLRYMLQGCLR